MAKSNDQSSFRIKASISNETEQGVRAVKQSVAKLKKDVEGTQILGPAVKPRFDSAEQRVRDTQAGILRARRRRDRIDQQRIDRAIVETEARRRIFNRSDSQLGRTDEVKAERLEEAAARARERVRRREEQRAAQRVDRNSRFAKYASNRDSGPILYPEQGAKVGSGGLQDIVRRAAAEARARDEAQRAAREIEIRRRRYGRSDSELGRTDAVRVERRRVASDLRLARHTFGRRDEAGLLGRGADYSDLTREYESQRLRSRNTYHRYSIDRPGGGYPSSRGMTGGGTRGFSGSGIGSLVRGPNSLNLGGGLKAAAPAAAAVAAVAALSAATEATAKALSLYKDNLHKGMTKQQAVDAMWVQLTEAGIDAAKQLPLIGGFISGLDAIGKEIDGTADKERRIAKGEAEDAKKRQAIADKAPQREAVKDDKQLLVEQQRDRAIREALKKPGSEGEAQAARLQAKNELDDALKAANKRKREIALAQGGAGGMNDVQREAAQKVVDRSITEAKQAYFDKLAAADKIESKDRLEAARDEAEERKKLEGDIFDVRQQYLLKEGQTLRAELEQAVRDAELQAGEAMDKANKVAERFGVDSQQARNAYEIAGQARDTGNARVEIVRQRIQRQAGRQAQEGLNTELARRAEQGDIVAGAAVAKNSVKIEYEDAAKEIKRAMDDAFLNGDKRLAETLKKRLGELPAEQQAAAERAVRQAVLDVRGERLQRTQAAGAGLLGDAQALADRAGRRGQQALEVASIKSEFRQRQLELDRLLNDAKVQGDERKSLEEERKSLEADQADRLKEAKMSPYTGRDLAGAVAAQAIGVSNGGGTTGNLLALQERLIGAGGATAEKYLQKIEKKLDRLEKLEKLYDLFVEQFKDPKTLLNG